MGGIFQIIYIAAIIGVFIRVFRVAKYGYDGKSGNSKSKSGKMQPSRSQTRSPALSVFDTGGDWLSRQRREELRAMGDMFGSEASIIAREHSSSCEAELLKEYHIDTCGSQAVKQDTRKTAKADGKPVSQMTKDEVRARKEELQRRRDARARS